MKRIANASYKLAQCEASAKTILANLGVRIGKLPEVLAPEVWKPSEPIKFHIERPKRFRRTREERQQLADFEQWQLQQRELRKQSKLDNVAG